MASKSKQKHKPAPSPGDARDRRDRTRIILAVIDAVRQVVLICAFFLPMLPAYWIAQVLAGKNTTVEIGIVVTLTLAAGAGLASYLTGRWKMTKQKEEVIRLRERCKNLEERLLECQKSQGRA